MSVQGLTPVILPSPFHNTSPTPTPIYQGAESHLLRTYYLTDSLPAALKIRLAKKWRHPTLDARLTKQRVLAEARVLVRLRREHVPVPAVYAVDWISEQGGAWLLMEWIGGASVRALLKDVKERDEKVKGLLFKVGEVIGRMHRIGVIHGDLTTSNVMVRGEDFEGEIVLIDFGLAMQSTHDEDRAVDLYVLERAFGSTHPKQEGLFDEEVLKGYKKGLGEKDSRIVLKRLDEVRLRGRKRSMVG